MPKQKIQGQVKGVARVKKFDESKDPETDVPDEVLEKKFDLTEEQAEEITNGRATAILQDGKLMVKKPDGTIISPEQYFE